MSITCKIEFENNPRNVVYAGQRLCGTVQIYSSRPITVRSLYIRIHGRAYVHWVDGTSDNRKLRVFTGNEDYFSERTNFVGQVRLEPGEHTYIFQCLLPPNLPTSLETEYGYIRYTARVVLDNPQCPDKSFAVPFTVIKAVDLNNIPELRRPLQVERNETFYLCCILCCCSSNPMKIVARTPVGGYCPGQFINLEIRVNNESRQSIFGFYIHLIKKITFFIHAESVRQKNQTAFLTKQHVSYRGNEETVRANIQVPPIPPTDFSTSNIIKFRYFLRISVSVSCCYNDPVLELPITIGTYPLQDNVPPLSMRSMQSHNIEVNEVTDPSTPLLPPNNVILQQPTAAQQSHQNNYSTMSQPIATLESHNTEDPPTYEEAMQLCEAAGSEFRPVYPVFKRSTSYSSGNSIQ